MALNIKRKKTKIIKIGNISIGVGYPIAIQSMVKVPTKEIRSVIREISSLEKSGCEIIRVAVKDADDARSLEKIKKSIGVPLVADIHFNYKLALIAIESGVDKIRLNPGNIYKKVEVGKVAKMLLRYKIPVRVGVNSGSLLSKYNKIKDASRRLVNQAVDYTMILEDFGVKNIVVSLKASNILETVEAYRIASERFNYPLHLGVTATGLFSDGIIKSSLGIGMLLAGGIGDTIRVSLLADPIEEIKVAQQILASLDIRRFGPEYICCPTCGRCEVNLRKEAQNLAQRIERNNRRKFSGKTIAVMGCMVNGPGEAKHADIGIAFGGKKGILFKKGAVVETLPRNRCMDRIIKEINSNDRKKK